MRRFFKDSFFPSESFNSILNEVVDTSVDLSHVISPVVV